MSLKPQLPMPDSENIPNFSDDWIKALLVDCFVLKVVDVDHALPVEERYHHHLIAVPIPDSNLRSVVCGCYPLSAFSSAARLPKIKPGFIRRNHPVLDLVVPPSADEVLTKPASLQLVLVSQLMGNHLGTALFQLQVMVQEFCVLPTEILME